MQSVPVNLSAIVGLSGNIGMAICTREIWECKVHMYIGQQFLSCRSLRNKIEGSHEAARRAGSLPILLCHGRDGFSNENFLAEGGYGPVYRGVLTDGQVVAVKQHKVVSAYGAFEFWSEIEVLRCAQHKNLVMLVGYCIEKNGSSSMILLAMVPWTNT
ncbi:hypothetical protein HHK36_020741 [Tetracentron sinense]|uniref:Protein kinase domain-containing protein n=1 Tax=Tetracentron sinense TaxID=13715 RepID=A0A835D943_TETSI|nr:hypothetical protein HHK36_020741 [Tetracentron sinense]